MTYRVELTLRAARDLEDLYQQIRGAESPAAARWYNALEKAIRTLEHLPRRCPVAPEAGKVKRHLRHLLYGRKPHVCRVLYEIDEPHKTVHVQESLHGSNLLLTFAGFGSNIRR